MNEPLTMWQVVGIALAELRGAAGMLDVTPESNPDEAALYYWGYTPADARAAYDALAKLQRHLSGVQPFAQGDLDFYLRDIWRQRDSR